jgi:uncharacterized protein DUF1801
MLARVFTRYGAGQWFEYCRVPLSDWMKRVRDIILGADRRILEDVQYSTVCFHYRGDLASFVQLTHTKRVSLMFNTGAKIPGDFPHLVGTGPKARFMRFASLAEVEERAPELRKIVRAWCNMKDREAPAAKKKNRKKKAAVKKKAAR